MRAAALARGDRLLDLDGAFERVDDAGELGQHAVAGGVGDPAAVPARSARRWSRGARERRQRRLLVDVHQPAIAFDIGGEDGDELALERRRFHHGDFPIEMRFSGNGNCGRLVPARPAAARGNLLRPASNLNAPMEAAA